MPSSPFGKFWLLTTEDDTLRRGVKVVSSLLGSPVVDAAAADLRGAIGPSGDVPGSATVTAVPPSSTTNFWDLDEVDAQQLADLIKETAVTSKVWMSEEIFERHHESNLITASTATEFWRINNHEASRFWECKSPTAAQFESTADESNSSSSGMDTIDIDPDDPAAGGAQLTSRGAVEILNIWDPPAIPIVMDLKFTFPWIIVTVLFVVDSKKNSIGGGRIDTRCHLTLAIPKKDFRLSQGIPLFFDSGRLVPGSFGQWVLRVSPDAATLVGGERFADVVDVEGLSVSVISTIELKNHIQRIRSSWMKRRFPHLQLNLDLDVVTNTRPSTIENRTPRRGLVSALSARLSSFGRRDSTGTWKRTPSFGRVKRTLISASWTKKNSQVIVSHDLLCAKGDLTETNAPSDDSDSHAQMNPIDEDDVRPSAAMLSLALAWSSIDTSLLPSPVGASRDLNSENVLSVPLPADCPKAVRRVSAGGKLIFLGTLDSACVLVMDESCDNVKTAGIDLDLTKPSFSVQCPMTTAVASVLGQLKPIGCALPVRRRIRTIVGRPPVLSSGRRLFCVVSEGSPDLSLVRIAELKIHDVAKSTRLPTTTHGLHRLSTRGAAPQPVLDSWAGQNFRLQHEVQQFSCLPPLKDIQLLSCFTNRSNQTGLIISAALEVKSPPTLWMVDVDSLRWCRLLVTFQKRASLDSSRLDSSCGLRTFTTMSVLPSAPTTRASIEIPPHRLSLPNIETRPLFSPILSASDLLDDIFLAFEPFESAAGSSLALAVLSSSALSDKKLRRLTSLVDRQLLWDSAFSPFRSITGDASDPSSPLWQFFAVTPPGEIATVAPPQSSDDCHFFPNSFVDLPKTISTLSSFRMPMSRSPLCFLRSLALRPTAYWVTCGTQDVPKSLRAPTFKTLNSGGDFADFLGAVVWYATRSSPHIVLEGTVGDLANFSRSSSLLRLLTCGTELEISTDLTAKGDLRWMGVVDVSSLGQNEVVIDEDGNRKVANFQSLCAWCAYRDSFCPYMRLASAKTLGNFPTYSMSNKMVALFPLYSQSKLLTIAGVKRGLWLSTSETEILTLPSTVAVTWHSSQCPTPPTVGDLGSRVLIEHWELKIWLEQACLKLHSAVLGRIEEFIGSVNFYDKASTRRTADGWRHVGTALRLERTGAGTLSVRIGPSGVGENFRSVDAADKQKQSILGVFNSSRVGVSKSNKYKKLWFQSELPPIVTGDLWRDCVVSSAVLGQRGVSGGFLLPVPIANGTQLNVDVLTRVDLKCVSSDLEIVVVRFRIC